MSSAAGDDVLIVTTNDLPGYRVDQVFGLTVRSRNVASQLGAGLKSIVGGELKGMTRNLEDSREEVLERLAAAAAARGANAVVAMRFDTCELANAWSEVCAYGTAVRVRPLRP